MHTVVFELQAVNGVQYQFSLKFSIAYGRRSGLLVFMMFKLLENHR